MNVPSLILASQSPRRRELIQLLNCPVEAISVDADEDSIQHPDPVETVLQIAHLKADLMAARLAPGDGRYLIAADTTVVLEGQMLGKPVDEAHARGMLQALRGRTHEVHTAVVILAPATGQKITQVTTATVTMRPYSDEEIEAYIASGDPMDKAGAYAIQHPTFRPVAGLSGCYTNVVGLPVCQLAAMLQQLGLEIAINQTAVTQICHQPGFSTCLLAG